MQKYGRLSKSKKNTLQASVSAIHAGGFGLGATLGPVLGSVFTATIGYRMAFTVTAGIVFVLSFLHLGSQFFYTRLKPVRGNSVDAKEKGEHLLTTIQTAEEIEQDE